MKKWNITIRYTGFALLGVSLLMFLAAFIAFKNDRDDSFTPLLFSAMSTILCGIFAIIGTQPQDNITIEDGYRIVTGCWIAACSVGALPFLMYGGEFTIVNAFFESVSGFTTTGASILNNIQHRSFASRLTILAHRGSLDWRHRHCHFGFASDYCPERPTFGFGQRRDVGPRQVVLRRA